MPRLALIVPDSVADPRRVSGGDVYDLRVRDGLRGLGWEVALGPVALDDDVALAALLAAVPDGDRVLVDGLVASRAPGPLERESTRLRIVVLAHMVFAAAPAHGSTAAGEARALAAAVRVIATSRWTRDELVARGLARTAATDIAVPGAEGEHPAGGTPGGLSLLSVGAVAPHKGQDVLVAALAGLRDVPGWTCKVAGSTGADAAFAATVGRAARTHAIADRVRLTGALDRAGLDRAYARADLVVSASYGESYGMAIVDGLRRGIPVVATAVGGVPDAVAPSGAAVLVPPGDAEALGAALRTWMTDAEARRRLRRRALERRHRLPTWSQTALAVAAALERAA